MGLNDENAMRIVFDIETAPLPEAAGFIEPVEAPANYKDPAKIAEFIAAKQADNLERSGLDVDLCTIVAIGWYREGEGSVQALTRQDCDEDGLIEQFWQQATEGGTLHHLVGFNCLAFDLPVLMRRSQYLGIPAPAYQIDKYRHAQITDLAQVLSFNGAVRMRSLAFYAKRFGVGSLPGDCAQCGSSAERHCDLDEPGVDHGACDKMHHEFKLQKEITGANVAQAVAEGRWKDIRAHVSADVQRTARVAEKIGLMRVPAEMVL